VSLSETTSFTKPEGVNGHRVIYYNNRRIKTHSFKAREKREVAAPNASAAAPSASVTQLSASVAASARVVSSLVETRRAGCVVLLAVEEE
jgi:hypothetical protein